MIAFTYTQLSGFGWTFVRIVTVSVWMIRRENKNVMAAEVWFWSSIEILFELLRNHYLRNHYIETTKRISYEISAKLLSKNHFNYTKSPAPIPPAPHGRRWNTSLWTLIGIRIKWKRKRNQYIPMRAYISVDIELKFRFPYAHALFRSLLNRKSHWISWHWCSFSSVQAPL